MATKASFMTHVRTIHSNKTMNTVIGNSVRNCVTKTAFISHPEREDAVGLLFIVQAARLLWFRGEMLDEIGASYWLSPLIDFGKVPVTRSIPFNTEKSYTFNGYMPNYLYYIRDGYIPTREGPEPLSELFSKMQFAPQRKRVNGIYIELVSNQKFCAALAITPNTRTTREPAAYLEVLNWRTFDKNSDSSIAAKWDTISRGDENCLKSPELIVNPF